MRGARHLPVASNGLQGTIISSQGDVESDEVLAGLDVVEFLGRDASLFGCFVVESLTCSRKRGSPWASSFGPNLGAAAA